MNQKVIVIGAGIGGLSAAIRLQVAGYQVIVLEKNEKIGGKMYQWEQDGYRFDTGPSVITMRHVFEDLFAEAGRTLGDYLQLEAVDPMTRYFYQDGLVLDACSDLSAMAQQIEAINPKDVEGYLAYLAYAARIHRITSEVFIYSEPPTLGSFAKVPIQDWLKADPLRTMSNAINSHVESPALRQLLGRFATYVGGSPYLAPATLNVIAHVELTGGVWYPRGGIYQIGEALAKLATELGVEIQTGQGVAAINTNNGRVSGITTQSGKTEEATIVISNVDVAATYQHLLTDSGVPVQRITKMSAYKPSCSGFVMMLGVESQHDELAHHNIFFSKDYQAEFDAIFKQEVAPEDPTIYVAITSKTDAEHAPEGCENWFVLVNAPPISDKFDWNHERERYRDLVLQKLAERGFDIRKRIRTETIWTPHELEAHSGAWRGALYGPSANDRFAVFLRPHNRSQDVQGLYFAGGTTHPGGGVPMVMLSGKVAADMVIEDTA